MERVRAFDGRGRFLCPSGKQADYHEHDYFVMMHGALSANRTCDQLHFSLMQEFAHLAWNTMLERAMQRSGLYIDPKAHLAGHHRDIETQFCELGKMDPVFDLMRLVVVNRWAWGVFTLVMSYADTWLLGLAIARIAGVWL